MDPARRLGFRSGFEGKIAEELTQSGVAFEFEATKINYVVPESKHKYTPDFTFKDSTLIVETKGRFTAADRKKHLLIKQQHPHLDIRFVFQNSKNKISKGSKTTYADWCDKNGFQYADKAVPEEWLNE